MSVYVDCVGCEQRQLDTQRVLDYLDANGIPTTQSPESCDYAILITCAVDSSSERASLSKIDNTFSRMPSSAKLIIGGCLPKISPDKISGYEADTISPRNLDFLDSIFKNSISVPMSDIKYPNKSLFDLCSADYDSKTTMSPRQEYESAKRGFKIKIDEGCLGACSYCMIKNATGKLKSRDLEEVIHQLEHGVSQGERTIMLMGGDTGAYGRDFGTDFPALLKKVIGVEGDYGLYIHDFNVNWLIEDFNRYLDIFELDEHEYHKIKSINFPIQSGSDKILRLMNRPYRTKEAIDALTFVRSNFPSIKLGTHIIVGFPSETEEDFSSTVKLLKNVDFDFVTCFPYSENAGARSAKISNKVSQSDVERRMNELSNMLQDKVKLIR